MHPFVAGFPRRPIAAELLTGGCFGGTHFRSGGKTVTVRKKSGGVAEQGFGRARAGAASCEVHQGGREPACGRIAPLTGSQCLTGRTTNDASSTNRSCHHLDPCTRHGCCRDPERSIRRLYGDTPQS